MRLLNRHSRIILSALAALALSAAAWADLAVQIDRSLRGAPLRGSSIAISIRESDTNLEIVAVNAREPMIPASNMKLLTTGVALHILGPEFAFKTRLLHSKTSDGDRLIILGDGDPAFGDPELLEIMHLGDQEGLDVEAFLRLWIDAVRDAGVTNVSEVIVDDRIFDREFVHPTWPVDQLNRRYCAQVSGFNFHLNTLHFFPRPCAGTSRPDISNFTPHVRWLEIVNNGTCRSESQDRNDAWIARLPGSNRMRFHGNVKFVYRTPVPVTAHDMPSFFARLFTDRLRNAGVRVTGHRVSEPGDPASEGEIIGPVITSSISTVLVRCNRDSNNLYAEALLKRCGAAITKQPGSWVNGAAVARHAIHERLGSPLLTQSILISDGSGLSRDNRISPRTLTAWLNTFHNDSTLGPIFIGSLAEPGGEGTLRNRFRNTELFGARVQAKSGYISGVHCLSGFVTGIDGRRRSFSIMINDIPDPTTLQHARRLQEEIVAMIAADMAPAPAQLGSD